MQRGMHVATDMPWYVVHKTHAGEPLQDAACQIKPPTVLTQALPAGITQPLSSEGLPAAVCCNISSPFACLLVRFDDPDMLIHKCMHQYLYH